MYMFVYFFFQFYFTIRSVERGFQKAQIVLKEVESNLNTIYNAIPVCKLHCL